MPARLTRRVSRRRRKVFHAGGPEQLETRRLLTSQISGVVFHDADANATQDPGDTGIVGVLITLTGETTSGDAVSRRYVTQPDGTFEFTELPAGTYEVAESQPTSVEDGNESTSHDGVTVNPDSFASIVVGENDVIDDLNLVKGSSRRV